MESLNLLNQSLGTIVLALFLFIGLLYLARHSVNQFVNSFFLVISKSVKLASKAVAKSEVNLKKRNKEVLLQKGLYETERDIEKEFSRVGEIVEKDFSAYPAMHRKLSDLVTTIDEDYIKSTETPPSPPAWVDAVKAVGSISPAKSGPSVDTGDGKLTAPVDPMVGNILRDIHKTIIKQEANALGSYRKSTSVRHSLLKKMMPLWRTINSNLETVGKTITGLNESSRRIDQKISEYEEIKKKSDRSVKILSSSAFTQFFVAAFVMSIALGGAVINYNLIALPMSEMVGGASYIGNFKASNVAALVIILVEVSMGIFLLESLRVTSLFPAIGGMPEKMRKRFMWIAFTILLILATVESSLAFMRDIIAADNQSLKQSMTAMGSMADAAVTTAETPLNWIPTFGQMVMGFILPFALTFVAIPFESFVNNGRTVSGVVMETTLSVLSLTLRVLSSIASNIAKVINSFYDLIIFLPLSVEHMITHRQGQASSQSNVMKFKVENKQKTFKAFDGVKEGGSRHV